MRKPCALMLKLRTLSTAEQTALVERLLPRLFDGGASYAGLSSDNLSFETLERLVGIAFSTISVEEDHHRASGESSFPG